jgi:hypothetical protein
VLDEIGVTKRTIQPYPKANALLKQLSKSTTQLNQCPLNRMWERSGIMLATISHDTAIEQLEVEHAAVRALIETLSDEEMTRPDTIEYGLYWDQELSFKDLLAHLITYEAYALEALAAWDRGNKHPVIDAMETEYGGRQIHFGGIELRRPLTLAQVLDEWESTQARLMQAIRGLTVTDWVASAPFPTSAPMDRGGMLEIILVAPPRPPYRHLPIHIPDTQAYIRKLRT